MLTIFTILLCQAWAADPPVPIQKKALITQSARSLCEAGLLTAPTPDYAVTKSDLPPAESGVPAKLTSAQAEQVAEAVSTFITKHGHGRISHFEREVSFSKGSGQLIVKASAAVDENLRDHFVFAVNPKTGEILEIARDREEPLDSRTTTLVHDRFVVSTLNKRREGASHLIFDLKTQQFTEVKGRFKAEIILSADGQSAVMSSDHGTGRERDIKNSMLQLSWSDARAGAAAQTPAARFHFDGKIVANSPNLTRMVVDRNYGFSISPGSSASVFGKLPDLALATVAGSRLSFEPLPGWDAIRQQMESGAKSGLRLPFGQSRGELTEDGRFFSFEMNFWSNASYSVGRDAFRQDFKQSWVGLWDLREGMSPVQFTSFQMNSQDDIEPSPAHFSQQRLHIWPRKFTSKLLPNGTVVVARATVKDLPNRLATIQLNIAEFNSQKPVQIMHRWDSDPLDLDPTGRAETTTGVHILNISDDGRFVNMAITGNGTRVVDRDLLESSLPALQQPSRRLE